MLFVLAGKQTSRMCVLEKDTGDVRELRPVNEKSISAMLAVLENPCAMMPYEHLAILYREMGMSENAEHIDFLVQNRFGGVIANRSNPVEEQRRDAGQDSGVACVS